MDANNSHGYITSPLTLCTSLQDQDASDKKMYPNFSAIRHNISKSAVALIQQKIWTEKRAPHNVNTILNNSIFQKVI